MGVLRAAPPRLAAPGGSAPAGATAAPGPRRRAALLGLSWMDPCAGRRRRASAAAYSRNSPCPTAIARKSTAPWFSILWSRAAPPRRGSRAEIAGRTAAAHAQGTAPGRDSPGYACPAPIRRPRNTDTPGPRADDRPVNPLWACRPLGNHRAAGARHGFNSRRQGFDGGTPRRPSIHSTFSA